MAETNLHAATGPNPENHVIISFKPACDCRDDWRSRNVRIKQHAGGGRLAARENAIKTP